MINQQWFGVYSAISFESPLDLCFHTFKEASGGKVCHITEWYRPGLGLSRSSIMCPKDVQGCVVGFFRPFSIPKAVRDGGFRLDCLRYYMRVFRPI